MEHAIPRLEGEESTHKWRRGGKKKKKRRGPVEMAIFRMHRLKVINSVVGMKMCGEQVNLYQFNTAFLPGQRSCRYIMYIINRVLNEVKCVISGKVHVIRREELHPCDQHRSIGISRVINGKRIES